MAFGSQPVDSNLIPVPNVYVPGTGFIAMQGGIKTFTDASSNVSAPVRVESVGGSKATYTYAIAATAPYATPTDWIVIRGSSTKAVKLVHLELSGAATAATEVLWLLKKHTIANTGGTSTNPSFMQHDSADGVPTSLILLYSVAPTIDASATLWKPIRMTLAVAPAATTVNPDRYVYDFADEPHEPLTLHGVAQEFALNFAGATVPSGGVMDVVIQVSEE